MHKSMPLKVRSHVAVGIGIVVITDKSIRRCTETDFPHES